MNLQVNDESLVCKSLVDDLVIDMIADSLSPVFDDVILQECTDRVLDPEKVKHALNELVSLYSETHKDPAVNDVIYDLAGCYLEGRGLYFGEDGNWHFPEWDI